MGFYKNIVIFISLVTFSFCYKDQAGQIFPKKYIIPVNEKNLIDRSNQIGIYYFNYLSQNKKSDENLIVSPIGISFGLNSLISSLSDNSKENIKHCFGYSNLKDSLINVGYRSLFRIFTEIDKNTSLSNIDNFVFSKELVLSNDFLSLVRKNKNLKHTFDQNEEMLDKKIEGEADSYALKLVNNFDFKGRGKYQERLEKLPFYYSPDRSDFLDMVASEALYNYYGDAAIKAIEIPLGRGNFNILILIPKEEHSVEDISSRLSLKLLSRIKNKFEPQHIEVFIPKMHLSTMESFLNQKQKTSNLYPFSMGLNGIVKDGSCYLYDFQQVINFDFIDTQNPELDNSEKTQYPDQDKKDLLFVDRPFIFIVYEKYSDAIILMGRIMNP